MVSAWPQWVWHGINRCGMVSVGVACPHWVWDVLIGCETCCQLVQLVISGCDMDSVGVSMASGGGV